MLNLTFRRDSFRGDYEIRGTLNAAKELAEKLLANNTTKEK